MTRTYTLQDIKSAEDRGRQQAYLDQLVNNQYAAHTPPRTLVSLIDAFVPVVAFTIVTYTLYRWVRKAVTKP